MELLYAKDRREWRNWLRKNAAKCVEIWLVYYKRNSGRPRVSYDEAVEEALCFGWIDGKIQKLDEARYCQRFTPRKADSRWSALNIQRVERLISEGKMAVAGLAAFRGAKSRQSQPMPAQLPGEIETQFKKNALAWRNFQSFPPGYRRLTSGWVASAKKEETRLKRLDKLIDFSARNERIRFM